MDRYERLSATFLIAVLAYSVWRASHAAITVDEAFTYLDFVEPPLWRTLTAYYDANNHVLHSLLCRWSVSIFGLSELSLRLPALLGTTAYLFALYRISGQLFRGSWLMPASVLFLSAHPTVLEFLSLARGYGLALACWSLAVWLIIEGRWRWTGVLLGLAVCFNLVFLVPGIALLAATFGKWRWAVPATFGAVPAVILGVPLSRAGREHFYFGVHTLWESARTVLGVQHQEWLTLVLVVLLSAGMLTALIRSTHESGKWLARAALSSLAMLVVGHWLTGGPYPFWRTGIYWVPLAGLCLFLVVPRKLSLVMLAGVLALCPIFVEACPPDFSTFWRFNASGRRIAERLKQQGATGIIAVSPALDHSTRWYSRVFGMDQQITVVKFEEAVAPGRYILALDHQSLVKSKGLQVEYRDPQSGVVVAVPVSAGLANPM